jgi:D-serine deaminase-like pyridoxal phosphate-dependent protein
MEEKIETDWYAIEDIDAIDSPALVIYPERVKENINVLVAMIDDVSRLRPHVKTHKSKEATALIMKAGITKFKCATIAEAEMLAMSGASDILLAYQPSLPKILRFISLIKKYPACIFSCLVDNEVSAKMISGASMENDLKLRVYVDVNVGMNRTGLEAGSAVATLYKYCNGLDGITPIGLHVYDGHIRTNNLEERRKQCDAAFEPVFKIQKQLTGEGFPEPVIVAGGSPTFPIYAKRDAVECSPGTFIFWDYSYQSSLTEQLFLTSALVITRIISFPADGKLCLDLGHKSIAAENELNKRVHFLNAPDLNFISQSEEHLVMEVELDHRYKIGDVFYGLPYHICPTVALYERAITVENEKITGEWRIIARDRKITI